MGTGKTKALIGQLDSYKYVIAISFRRSFASDLSAKARLTNYMDIPDGDISLNQHPKICVQIDSLHRLTDFL